MQAGDIVLWKGMPHFVHQMVAQTYKSGGPEILFRTPAQFGRDRGLANGGLRDEKAFYDKVAGELGVAGEADVEWARASAAAARAGEALPPPRLALGSWRWQSRGNASKISWCSSKDKELTPSRLHDLRTGDVVRWCGKLYFVSALQDGEISLQDPETYATPGFATTENLALPRLVRPEPETMQQQCRRLMRELQHPAWASAEDGSLQRLHRWALPDYTKVIEVTPGETALQFEALLEMPDESYEYFDIDDDVRYPTVSAGSDLSLLEIASPDDAEAARAAADAALCRAQDAAARAAEARAAATALEAAESDDSSDEAASPPPAAVPPPRNRDRCSPPAHRLLSKAAGEDLSWLDDENLDPGFW